MKILIKYWPVVYAVLIAVYESYAFVSSSDLLPFWVKSIFAVFALMGLIAKSYKTKK